jgi:DNA-directed RNA polymerase specialized sigma24 family protein
MSEREIDQALVERAQGGDKHAFDLLVSKYQRKLGRLLSRFIRDSAEVEDVAQEAFIKAYRALPSFRGDSAFLYLALPYWHQYRKKLFGIAGPPCPDFDQF